MKLEKRKLNDGSYEYYWGYDIVDCAEEIGTEKPVFVYAYADYYQFRHRPTRLIFSTKKISEYSHSDGDLTLVFTTTMWKKGINIFTEEAKKI